MLGKASRAAAGGCDPEGRWRARGFFPQCAARSALRLKKDRFLWGQGFRPRSRWRRQATRSAGGTTPAETSWERASVLGNAVYAASYEKDPAVDPGPGPVDAGSAGAISWHRGRPCAPSAGTTPLPATSPRMRRQCAAFPSLHPGDAEAVRRGAPAGRVFRWLQCRAPISRPAHAAPSPPLRARKSGGGSGARSRWTRPARRLFEPAARGAANAPRAGRSMATPTSDSLSAYVPAGT